MGFTTMGPADLTTDIYQTTDSPLTSSTESYNMTTLIPMVTNMTTVHPSDPDCPPLYWGFITALIAIVFYGTNFVPVKKFDTGDGMFFQWIVCIALWCGGLVVHLVRHSPTFYPLCMVGGSIWVVGNVCVVPIIKTIGLGLGLCIWGMTNLFSGWATGRFGLFGVKAEKPDNPTLNYIGVSLALCSAIIFSMIKNDVSLEDTDATVTVETTERSPLLGQSAPSISDPSVSVTVFGNSHRGETKIKPLEAATESDESFLDMLNPSMKRIVGITLSLVSGLLYGQMFTPTIYIQDQHSVLGSSYHGSSTNGLDYVFSTFSGILLSSTFVFLVYAAFRRNKPKIYPRAILPGFISGIMWSIATSSWFVANKVLSEPVSFPIITTGPGILASLLGVFVFKEIKGRRNILILAGGICVTLTGAVLCGLSKKAAKSC